MRNSKPLEVCNAYGILPVMRECYSDSDLEAAAGLTVLHVRRLITWGAVTPAKGGKGVVRQWHRSDIRHVACVAALYKAGLSLPVAHTLGMLIPARFALAIIDPDAVLQPAVKNKWFNAKLGLQAVEKSDVILTIVNGYSIFWRLGASKTFCVGKLANDRSIFLSALDYSDFRECDPRSLSWRHQGDLGSARAQSEAAQELRHPISETKINLSLACKVAMRRLLSIPVFFDKKPRVK